MDLEDGKESCFLWKQIGCGHNGVTFGGAGDCDTVAKEGAATAVHAGDPID